MLQHLVPERLAQLFTQMQDQQSVTVHVEKKLGHPLRADGPILGVEFKPLPPGAFGAPLGIVILPTLPKLLLFALSLDSLDLGLTVRS